MLGEFCHVFGEFWNIFCDPLKDEGPDGWGNCDCGAVAPINCSIMMSIGSHLMFVLPPVLVVYSACHGGYSGTGWTTWPSGSGVLDFPPPFFPSFLLTPCALRLTFSANIINGDLPQEVS